MGIARVVAYTLIQIDDPQGIHLPNTGKGFVFYLRLRAPGEKEIILVSL